MHSEPEGLVLTAAHEFSRSAASSSGARCGANPGTRDADDTPGGTSQPAANAVQPCGSCCSTDFCGTNRICGRLTASQIASASCASFLLALDVGFTNCGEINRAGPPHPSESQQAGSMRPHSFCRCPHLDNLGCVKSMTDRLKSKEEILLPGDQRMKGPFPVASASLETIPGA